MTKLVRYCPSCQTERGVSEVSCEGEVSGSQCNWDLLGVSITPEGWRPVQVKILDVPIQNLPNVHSCTNGHQLELGDLICPTCGAEPADINFSDGNSNSQSLETVIAGWRVISQIKSTSVNFDKYLVEEVGGIRRAYLTLYHLGFEPDSGIYIALRKVPLEHVHEIYDSGRWEQRTFEVTEELDGTTIDELGIFAIDSSTIRRVAYEIGKALDALAEVGLRHRDIRPSNLLVRNRDPLDLVIGGFGASRLSEYDLDIVSPLEMTRYAAPESVVGGIAAASDWWSLGIVLLEQVTRGKCFANIDQQAFLIYVLANGVPIPPDIPDDISLLLRGLLARDRTKRWKWKEVQAWLDGESPEAPEVFGSSSANSNGPAVTLAGKRYHKPSSYALAASTETEWNEAQDQLSRGVITDWMQVIQAPAQQIAALRRVLKDASLTDDWRMLMALKVLNPDMPPLMKGEIVSPKWLLENPIEAYDLICSTVPDLLNDIEQDSWLLRLKLRCTSVRDRAKNLGIELDESTVRVYLLSTSRSRLNSEWDMRRPIFPDSEHSGLLSLLERRSLNEEDLIVLLSAAPSQFRSCDALVEDARKLASSSGVSNFDVTGASETVTWPRGEILQAINERIEGFARCSFAAVNDWADQFRLEKRLPFAQALVLLSVPKTQWQEPQKQQYIAQLLSFFEKKVVTTVMRGPLVRMTIGKTTARVDLMELHTNRMDAEELLDHLLKRNSTPLLLDPSVLGPEESIGIRLQSLERQSELYKRDTGIDGLYLGFPFLLTKEAKPGATSRIAPVLLWPVRVRHEVGARSNVQVFFDSEREEIRINPALETILGQETVKKWSKVADELLGRSALRASDVIDAFGMLAVPLSRKLTILPGQKTDVPARNFHLECAGVLFHMTYMGQAVGEEIRMLRALPPAGTGLETALRLSSIDSSDSIDAIRPKEADRYFTASSDPSQEAAVFQARKLPGLLVEGPPGTGKSQTIVNIVGDAIGQGRSVLIVCQKHAALEVVYKRLVSEGLGDRVVMVNDVNKDRQPIIRAVREQVEALFRRTADPVTAIRRKREAIAARIDSNESTLDRHHEALHLVNDSIGLSYRVLLGELIRLEQHVTVLEVPALRTMLQPLNIGQLASLEEEVAPAVRHWLPAKYEGSALAQLLPFSADQATLNEFQKYFRIFVNSEEVRYGVLNTRPSSFEVEDPQPHRTWLSMYGNEFLDLQNEQRIFLVKWLPLFRGTSEAALTGHKCIADLKSLNDSLTACRSQDFAPHISPVLCHRKIEELKNLRSITVEALEPTRFFSFLNVFKILRARRVSSFLNSVGDQSTQRSLQVLLAAIDLELTWRPLREGMIGVYGRLSLAVPDTDAGPTMRSMVDETLSTLESVAGLADHLKLAPWVDRMDKVALCGTRDMFLNLFAEFDSAFARHQVRSDSQAALSSLRPWMLSTWVKECETAIAENKGASTFIKPVDLALPSLAAYQLFRGRAAQLSVAASQLFALLRTKEVELSIIPPFELEEATRRIINREARLGWKQLMEQSSPELSMDQSELSRKVIALEELDKDMRELNRQLLQVDIPMSNIRPMREWEDITRLSGQRARRLREFVEIGADLGLMSLRPIWLMNPDVASRLLPLKAAFFGTVIYDEASQMPVEFALPTLFRGKVTVVSGDEKQMPPATFFSSKLESDESQLFDGELPTDDASPEEKDAFDETWNRREIKDCPDLLQLAKSTIPNLRLQIHYRSSYRELIAYSNAAFYGNDLSVPVQHPDETVKSVKPIEMIRVNGVYQNQTNPEEADEVVDILAQIWKQPYASRPSLGVVTFNRKQADLIEDKIELRAENDSSFRQAYSEECSRYEEGEDMSFFVKNVENVQGDERDIIAFSSTFGRNTQGSFLRFFGILGQKGGERRLNVAITRARKKIYMLTSMPISEISDFLTTRHAPATPRDYLQGYMEYARLLSAGELTAARVLLSRVKLHQEGKRIVPEQVSIDAFNRSVGDYIFSLGYNVKSATDKDAFSLDFAIEHPETGLFAIGIECDAPQHPLLKNARSREVWRPQVLKRSLTTLHRVTSQGWYHEGEQERINLHNAIKMALQDRN